jgi:hypothetical protein
MRGKPPEHAEVKLLFSNVDCTAMTSLWNFPEGHVFRVL